MNYNIAGYHMIYIDTDETTVILNQLEKYSILDVSELPITTLSGTDKFVLYCDLGCRMHVEDIIYYFSSSYTPAGTVNIYYKNEYFQEYTSLATFVDNTKYTTTVSGYLGADAFAPRYIKLEHDLTSVSGTVSGTLHGFEILNYDDTVNFGLSGDATVTEFEVAQGGLSQIQAVPIYNNGSHVVDAFISLEPTYTDVDDIVSIGLTETGPWTYSLEEAKLIADFTNFSSGIYENVEVTDSLLTLSNIQDYNGVNIHAVSNGTYTSRIFYLTPEQQNRLLINVDDSPGGYMTFDDDKLISTIKIRSSNAKPVDYNIYRELYQIDVGSSKYVYYRDRWTKDGSIKESQGWGFTNIPDDSTLRSYFITMDHNTERVAGIFHHWTTSSYSGPDVRLFNNLGTTSYTLDLMSSSTGAPLIHTVKYVILDANGGVWIYFYGQTYGSSQFVDDTGYYLAYFNDQLTNRFKYFFSVDFIGDMSVDYLSGNLWYTYPSSQTIISIDMDGNTLYTITEDEDTNYLGGITVMTDRTVWYANNGSLIHLSAAGVQMDKITEMLEDSEVYDKLATDPSTDEALWAIWGFNVYRIFVTGEQRGLIDMSFTIEGALHIFPVKAGCWVWAADLSGAGFNHMHFISKENRRVDLDVKVNEGWTTSSLEPSNSVFAPFDLQWNDEGYIEKQPIILDTDWKDLTYTEVSANDIIFSEDDKYYQMQIKLKTQEAYERYDLPYGTEFISEDNFNQPDGQPQNIQLWESWSSDSDVYVENNQLVMASGTTGWISTRNRVAVSGDLDFRAYFSYGETNPVPSNQLVYLYIRGVSPQGENKWWRAYLRIDTNGSGYIYVTTYTGGTGGGNSRAIDATNTGIRIRISGSTLYYYFLDSTGSWYGPASYTGITGDGGTVYYAYLEKGTGSNEMRITKFEIANGDVYYYRGAPLITSIYSQEAIKLSEVYPGNSKNIYVKAQVGLNKEVSYQEEAQLRVRWREPVE